MSLNVIDFQYVLCVQDKTCKFFLPLSVSTQVMNLLNGIWRHHLLSNKVGQYSCPLNLDNNHSKCSVICVRFMYKYLKPCVIFFSFLNPTPFVLFRFFSLHFNLSSISEKTIQTGFGKQRKQSLISCILCICFFCLELHDCYYYAV